MPSDKAFKACSYAVLLQGKFKTGKAFSHALQVHTTFDL